MLHSRGLDEEDLQATAESIRDDARRLSEIEAEIAGLHASPARRRRLSDESIEIASRLHLATLVERELVAEIAGARETPARLN